MRHIERVETAEGIAALHTFIQLYIRERDTGVDTTTRGRINDFQHLSTFCQAQGIHLLREITPAHIYGFLEARERAGDSPRTRLRRFHNIRSLLKYAVHRNVIDFNPAQYVKEPSIPYSEPRSMSAEETQIIRVNGIPTEWGELRYSMAIEIMLNMGLRIGEVLAIKQKSVDVLTLSFIDIIGKGGKIFTAAIPDAMNDLLIAYLQARHAHIENKFPEYRYLSPSERGAYPFICSTWGASLDDPESFQFTARALRNQIKERNEDVHPHRLRHTFVKEFYEATKDPVLTKQAARHDRLETTMRYAASTLDAIRAAQNKMKK